MRKWIVYALAFAGAWSCTVETHHYGSPPPASVGTGVLNVDWTIGGVKASDECALNGVTDIDISVFTSGGHDIGTFTQACEAFATSIDLDPGSYSATAVLVDGYGRDRTTSIEIEPFSIEGNDQLTIPIDFPLDSFH